MLILDQIVVPEQLRGRGYGTTMIRQIAAHFDYLLPAAVVLAWPSPTNLNDLDPFTTRAAMRRTETVLNNVGMQRLDDSPIWCATLSAAGGGTTRTLGVDAAAQTFQRCTRVVFAHGRPNGGGWSIPTNLIKNLGLLHKFR
ncbi:N-acetyltransferase [Rudaeicoccus suwonensis]|uniref:N-acetyltransferase n=1 Tax=Rudaeicoccus suwonensis TaxID=657409 RepID=UPI0011A6A89D|nr:N-acetyltransferase [Rudaeicoccus suwonensis]